MTGAQQAQGLPADYVNTRDAVTGMAFYSVCFVIQHKKNNINESIIIHIIHSWGK